MTKKRVLVISFYFPPCPAMGGQRAAGLEKFLPDNNWDVTVITGNLSEEVQTKNNIIKVPFNNLIDVTQGGPSGGNTSNSNLKRKIKKLGRTFLHYPDKMISWKKPVIKEIESLIKTKKYDAIISTSSPFTAHIIANEVKKKYNIPWLADLRDLWTQNPGYFDYYLRPRYLLERKLEKKTLSCADALVTVSEPLKDKLASLHKSVPVYSVLNGFNPDDYIEASVNNSSTFDIVYTGKIYNDFRDPSPLFNGIQELIAEESIDESDIRIRFIGPPSEYIANLTTKYHLQNVVKQEGFIERDKTIEIQKQAQMLLMLTWNDPKEQGILSGKFFEYVGAKRPILAVGYPDKTIKNILEKGNIGYMIQDSSQAKEFITNAYNQFKSQGQVTYSGTQEYVDKFSHKQMAKQFTEILNSIIE